MQLRSFHSRLTLPPGMAILLLFFLTISCGTISEERMQRILFIGNSYTYYNDIPAQLGRMAAEAGIRPEPEVESITAGGAELVEHLENPEVLEALASGNWDAVVLQGQSLEPLRNPEGFLGAAEKLAAAAAAGGSRVFFYETWAREAGKPLYEYPWTGGSPAGMQAALHASYADAAEACDAVLIPVGSHWLNFSAAHPETGLYAEDGAHPSPQGSHLAATVLAYYLLAIDPLDIQYIPWGVEPGERERIAAYVSATAPVRTK